MKHRIGYLACAAIMGWNAAPAMAQAAFPDKPVTILVGFAPGGGTDIIARLIGPELSKQLGQPVVIENRAGASGTIAATAASRAAPDGYTLLMGHVSSNAMVPAINSKLNYDSAKDFSPISLIGSVPQVVVVPSTSTAATLPSFLELVKTKKGGVNYASSGVGTQQHFAAEMFQLATGTKMVHVPYRGSGAALADLLAGVVDVTFDTVPTVLSHVREGRLRALAVTTPQRIASLPDVPTVAESGLPGYEISAWYMLMGPAGLPDSRRDVLANAMHQALQSDKLRQRLTELNTDIIDAGPAQALQYLRSEVDKWRRIATEQNIVAD